MSVNVHLGAFLDHVEGVVILGCQQDSGQKDSNSSGGPTEGEVKGLHLRSTGVNFRHNGYKILADFPGSNLTSAMDPLGGCRQATLPPPQLSPSAIWG